MGLDVKKSSGIQWAASLLHIFVVIKLIASWVMVLGLYTGKWLEDGLHTGCNIGSMVFVSRGEHWTDMDSMSLMILGTVPGVFLHFFVDVILVLIPLTLGQ